MAKAAAASPDILIEKFGLAERLSPFSDDKRAQDVVIRLLDQLSFDGVDAGSLDESWRQQPATPIYGSDLNVEGVRKALAAVKQERSPEFRAEEGSPGMVRR